MADADRPTVSTVDRAKVLRGGLAGAVVGVVLLAVAVFFLLTDLDEPSQVLGVFLPLAVALIALGLGVAALVPLRWGDSDERSPGVIAAGWSVLAVVGVVVSVLGIVHGQLPWTLVAALPLLVSLLLIRDARRMRSSSTRALG